MKTKIAKLILSFIVLFLSVGLMAQTPPHPPSTGHGQTGNQAPGTPGAPIGSGIALLIGLGAAYGAKKTLNASKQEEE